MYTTPFLLLETALSATSAVSPIARPSKPRKNHLATILTLTLMFKPTRCVHLTERSGQNQKGRVQSHNELADIWLAVGHVINNKILITHLAGLRVLMWCTRMMQ